MFWPLRSSLQTCPRLAICKATVLDLAKCFMLLPVLGVWRLCAYGLDFNPTPDPWLQSSAKIWYFYLRLPTENKWRSATCFPHFSAPFHLSILRSSVDCLWGWGRLSQGLWLQAVLPAVNRMAGQMQEPVPYRATWWKGFDPLKPGQKQPFRPAMCLSLHFRAGHRVLGVLTALRRSLSPVSLQFFFFPTLSLGQKPHISPLVWGFFFPLCSYLFCSFWAGRP